MASSEKQRKSLCVCACGKEHFLMVWALAKIPLKRTGSGEAVSMLGRSRALQIHCRQCLCSTSPKRTRRSRKQVGSSSSTVLATTQVLADEKLGSRKSGVPFL